MNKYFCTFSPVLTRRGYDLYNSITEAVDRYYTYFEDKNIKMYLYTVRENNISAIPVGIVEAGKNLNNHFTIIESTNIQYDATGPWLDPLDNICFNLKHIKPLNEWSMASVNPILSTIKPFILKVVNDNNNILSRTNFAFTPDLISDKYFIVNEDGKVDKIDRDKLNELDVTIYDCKNKDIAWSRAKDIVKAYENKITVGSDYIYETLSGSKMITPDQIDTDDQFEVSHIFNDFNTLLNI